MGRYLEIARLVLDEPDRTVDSSIDVHLEKKAEGTSSADSTRSSPGLVQDSTTKSTNSTKSEVGVPKERPARSTENKKCEVTCRPRNDGEKSYTEWSPSDWEELYENKRLIFRSTGLSRRDAEAQALLQVKALLIEHTDWPSSESTLDSQIHRARHGACFTCGSSRSWKSRTGRTLCAVCHPSAPETLVARGIERDIQPGISRVSFVHTVPNDAVAKVNAIRERALSLSWSEEGLDRNHGQFPFPYGRGYGLVCFLGPDRSVGKIRTDSIEIVIREGDGRNHSLQFPNPDVQHSCPGGRSS